VSQVTLQRLADLASDDPDLRASLRVDFERALLSYGFDDLTDDELHRLRELNSDSGHLDDALWLAKLKEIAATA
jgi:hypothetical protein